MVCDEGNMKSQSSKALTLFLSHSSQPEIKMPGSQPPSPRPLAVSPGNHCVQSHLFCGSHLQSGNSKERAISNLLPNTQGRLLQ